MRELRTSGSVGGGEEQSSSSTRRTCQKLSFREKLPEKLVESKGKNITYDRY